MRRHKLEGPQQKPLIWRKSVATRPGGYHLKLGASGQAKEDNRQWPPCIGRRRFTSSEPLAETHN